MNFSKTYLPLFKGIDLTQRRLPMMVARTDKPGPIIWLTAAIHGDEVTGIAVIQSVFKRLEQSPLLKGSLYAFPILNPMGFEMISRAEPVDEEDLNRSFGGDQNGSLAERHAALIANTIFNTHPDMVIDLHTDSMNSIAYTILDNLERPDSKSTEEKSRLIARDLGFSWAIDNNESTGYAIEHSLSGFLISQGIPAVTVELGGPMVVVEEFRKLGLEAVWRLLYLREMVRQKPNNDGLINQITPYVFYERLKTQSTGLFDYRARAGEKVKKGKILGKIRDVFGETIEIIRSPFTCYLFSHDDQSVVFPGQSLFTLARNTKELGLEKWG